MLHEGFLPENLAAVKLGIATHNLFDVAYALVLATENDAPRRTHYRRYESSERNPIARGWQQFQNEPDTDWTLPHHAEWAEGIIASWDGRVVDIPLVIAGREIRDDRDTRNCVDPSRPGVVVGGYRQASGNNIEAAAECARADDDGWRAMAPLRRLIGILILIGLIYWP